MSRSRSRLAADWFAKLRSNATTGVVEHEEVAAVQTEVTTTVSSQIATIEAQVANMPSPIVAGTVAYLAMVTAPTGWLKANGAAISRTTYADLFAAIGTTYGAGDGSTTFNIPDLRGEFVRGFDDGRGADSGRGFGTAQAGDMAAHRHYVMNNGYANITAGWGYPVNSGNQIASAYQGQGYENYHLQAHSGEANSGRSSLTGGSDNRPRNIAMLACIKY